MGQLYRQVVHPGVLFTKTGFRLCNGPEYGGWFMWVKCRISLFTITLIALVLCATTAVAQVTSADIIGTVVDNSGGVITNATVTVTNLGTSVKRSMPTNSAGDYALTLLPIGTYSVSIE